MAIHLTTLGGLMVRLDDIELDRLLRQRSRAALLVYVAVERAVSREVLTTVFWPESTGENARHALRQSLYQLRSELGRDWLEDHPQELRTGTGVRADVHDLLDALDRQDPETAARLYEGPFLDGIHLVDLQPWESWVDERRAHYARAFRKACRAWLEARLADGDLPAAIEAARHWVTRDPLDDEAQHRLIETLAQAGERTDAIRQFEAYGRLLEAEDLRPLDETVELYDRIRSDATLPLLQPAADVAAVPPAAVAGPSSADRSLRRRVVAGGAAILVLLLGLVAAWSLGGRSDDATTTAPGSIAVLPFTVRGSEDARYLGDGMVTLLGTALDGATLRPVDTRAVFATVGGSGAAAPDLDLGRRHAARLGAGLFVLGDVVQAGESLQIEAAAYRTAAAAEPVARVVVNGQAERLFDLVDELAARLLAGLSPSSTDRLIRTAAATTGSLAAFKAYLEGEAEIRAGRFERAADSYLRALVHDSTFAVAHYRLALARDWAALSGYREPASAAARHAERLSPRDRALLEALHAYHEGDGIEAERRYRAILARYPDDLEAWLQLAESQFHYGPLRGRPSAESEEAWRHVLEYEPTNLWALIHLGRLAAAQGRHATIDSLLSRFGPAELVRDRRLVQLGVLRAVAAGDSVRALALAREASGWEDAAAYQLLAYLTAFTHEPEGARRVVATLIEPHRGPGMVADLHWFTALLHLSSGQLSAAQRAMAEAYAASALGSSDWHRRTFRLVTEWWAYTTPLPWPDSTLERVRRDAVSARLPRPEGAGQLDPDVSIGDEIWFALAREALGEPGRLEALRHYAVGALSLRLGETAGAIAASDSLRRLERSEPGSSFVRDVHRDLRALIALHDGRPEEGLRVLDQLEFEPMSLGAVNLVPFAARAHERYLRGELLVALGRDTEALPWFASLGALSVLESPYRAPAHLRQAQIHERLGDVEQAAWHYRRVEELWAEGDEAVRGAGS